MQRANSLLQNYAVEDITVNDDTKKDGTPRLLFSTLYHGVCEKNLRFSQPNSKLYAAVCVLQPENWNFLDIKMMRYLLDLAKCTTV